MGSTLSGKMRLNLIAGNHSNLAALGVIVAAVEHLPGSGQFVEISRYRILDKLVFGASGVG